MKTKNLRKDVITWRKNANIKINLSMSYEENVTQQKKAQSIMNSNVRG